MEPDCVGEGDAVGPLVADALPLFIPPEATHTLPVVNAIDPEAPEAPAKKKPRKGAEDFTIEQYEKATAFWEEYAAKNMGRTDDPTLTLVLP